MINKSFYQFVQTVKNPNEKDPAVQLASDIHLDIQFPKTAVDYHEISSYLEDHTYYVQSMDDFDALWQRYIENT